jgi:FKBP-type peptidyl-prolyl cis-trans isomerase
MNRRVFLIFAAALLASCNLDTSTPNRPSDPATETFAAALGVDISTMTKTPSGAYYKDLKPGSGTALTGLPVVNISYVEFLKDASLVGQIVGVNQDLTSMIPGIQEAIQGMKPGGERLMVIPSALAYGNSQTAVGVPPNSTLVVDLVFNNYSTQ